MKLTKKQIKEFAIHYIANQMIEIDGGAVGEIIDVLHHEDVEKVISEIHNQAIKIAKGRELSLSSPMEILGYVIGNF